jgi:hypothetical protein
VLDAQESIGFERSGPFNKIKRQQVNILLWVLQVLLAAWNVIGALYMVNNYGMLANAPALNALPKPGWIALGVLQVLFALGLVLPGALKALPKVTPISAAGLAVISLLGLGLYTAYAGFPGMLWGVVPAVLAAFVAYERLTGSR